MRFVGLWLAVPQPKACIRRCTGNHDLNASPCVEVMVRLRIRPWRIANHSPECRFRCSRLMRGAAYGHCCQTTWYTHLAWIWRGTSALATQAPQRLPLSTSSQWTTSAFRRSASKDRIQRTAKRPGAFAAPALPHPVATSAAIAWLQAERAREAEGRVAHLERTLGGSAAPGEGAA